MSCCLIVRRVGSDLDFQKIRRPCRIEIEI